MRRRRATTRRRRKMRRMRRLALVHPAAGQSLTLRRPPSSLTCRLPLRWATSIRPRVRHAVSPAPCTGWHPRSFGSGSRTTESTCGRSASPWSKCSRRNRRGLTWNRCRLPFSTRPRANRRPACVTRVPCPRLAVPSSTPAYNEIQRSDPLPQPWSPTMPGCDAASTRRRVRCGRWSTAWRQDAVRTRSVRRRWLPHSSNSWSHCGRHAATRPWQRLAGGLTTMALCRLAVRRCPPPRLRRHAGSLGPCRRVAMSTVSETAVRVGETLVGVPTAAGGDAVRRSDGLPPAEVVPARPRWSAATARTAATGVRARAR
mmetsp:Transcript_6680/g.21613  ORF Transcript_6680/g.21613 Transcript_6680/m.21613 type:complete len:315 (-) Transcript_6680:307-1251(-)